MYISIRRYVLCIDTIQLKTIWCHRFFYIIIYRHDDLLSIYMGGPLSRVLTTFFNFVVWTINSSVPRNNQKRRSRTLPQSFCVRDFSFQNGAVKRRMEEASRSHWAACIVNPPTMIPRWARPWVFVITCLVLASAVYFLSTDGFVTYFVKVRTGQSFLEQYCPDDASKLSSIVQSGKNSCPVPAIETLRAHQSGLYETNYRRSKIRLSYELGPVMPMGFQDSAGGILSGFQIIL